MAIYRCARMGCDSTFDAGDRGRPRKYCTDDCRIQVAKGTSRDRVCGAVPVATRGQVHLNHMGLAAAKAAQKSSGVSWWLNPGTFYAEARTRLPETGTPHVDRGKVHLGGPDGPTLGSRISQGRYA